MIDIVTSTKLLDSYTVIMQIHRYVDTYVYMELINIDACV